MKTLFIKIKNLTILTLLFFALFFKGGSLHSQAITDIEIIYPLDPETDCEIEAVISVWFGYGIPDSCPPLIFYELNKQNFTINAEMYYNADGVWPPSYCETIDTIKIENLFSSGNYTLVCKTYSVLYGDTVHYDTDTVNFSITCINNNKNSETISNFIKIFPIPANESVILEFIKEIKIEKIMLLDMQGKEVRVFDTQSTELDISNMPSGTYILKINACERVLTKKILINN